MSRTIAIIQARLGSSRLKAKLARKLGGKSLLEWVVRRMTDCQQLDGVVVATGDQPQDHRLAALVPPDVAVFVGSETDVLGRFVAAAEQFDADSIVRVCADNPFIDPALVDRLVTTARQQPHFDYISYCLQNGRPVILSPVGVFAEWTSTEALKRANAEVTSAADREHVTRYIYSHPEKFRVRLIPAPAALDRDDLRLTIDLEEDLAHAEAIYEALGPEGLDWQRIAGLLDHQPALRARMAHLNRAHAKV